MKFDPKRGLVIEDTDSEPIQEGHDQVEFVRLANKYMHHDPYTCTEAACIVCEGLGLIMNGQDDIAHAEQEKNRDHALDNAPF